MYCLSLNILVDVTACMTTGQVQIGILKDGEVMNPSSTVHYLKGNCTWTLTFSIGTEKFVRTRLGPEYLLPTSNIDVFTFQCEVNGSVELNASGTAYGESCRYLPNVCII